jgi:hypothetical protein
MATEAQQTGEDELLYERFVKKKKSLMDEFQARGIEAHERGEGDLTYSDFCMKKLTEAGLTEDQQILANSLIDLAIGIGRLQVLTELAAEHKRSRDFIVGFEQPAVSA